MISVYMCKSPAHKDYLYYIVLHQILILFDDLLNCILYISIWIAKCFNQHNIDEKAYNIIHLFG